MFSPCCQDGRGHFMNMERVDNSQAIPIWKCPECDKLYMILELR